MCGGDIQCVLKTVVELHDGRLIAAPVAVVGRAEDGHHISVMAPVVALSGDNTESTTHAAVHGQGTPP